MARRFGVILFLISLGILFVASMAGLIIVRVQLGRKGEWPADLPAPPWGLALSTLVLIISSVTIECAVRGAEASSGASVSRGFPRAMLGTFGLGLLFLAIQTACWVGWLGVVQTMWEQSDGWRIALMGFYVLTALHGAHVLGGLIALVVTIVRDGAGRYDAGARLARTKFCAMYWHFLGVVWLFVYALLLLWR